jgi:hypothetical protein
MGDLEKMQPRPSKRDFFRASRRNEGEERKKEQKQKTRGLWKLTLLMEIRKGRGFPQQLEKASQKTLGFFTVPTGPTTNINSKAYIVQTSARLLRHTKRA